MRVTRYNIWQWEALLSDTLQTMQLLSVSKKAFVLVLLFITWPTIANGAVWANWTSVGTDTASNVGVIGNNHSYTYVTTASGTLQDAATSSTANLTHTGEVITGGTADVGSELDGFTDWTDAGWLYPAAAFDDPNGNVGSPADANADILQHAGYTVESAKVHTITFDREVSGVVMAIWSLGGQGDATMRFSEDFVILATASGGGTGGSGLVKGNDNSSGYTITGGNSYGYNGLIQFYGTFGPSRPLQYTITDPEFYFGMSIASTGVALDGDGGDPVELAFSPKLAAPASTADGFTVQVSNYDAAYTWAVSTTAGSAAISNAGLVTVTGLTPEQSATVTVTTTRTGYANGTVTATGSASAAATAPGSPTGVTAVAGNAQATVSWTAPASNGGAAITSYTATAVEDNTKSCTTGDGSTLTCTVTGLTNGTAYTFTVTATNSGGTSAASSASSAVTPTGPALTPTFGTPTSTADGFTVQVSNYDANYTWAVSTTAGSATISNAGLVTVTGLTPEQSATVTVTTTRTGYAGGSATATGSASTGAPGSPTGVTAVAGNAQATVSWTAPASNGGAAITSYTATAVEDNTKSCTTANGSTLTCDVTGLTNGTAYTFTVRATNSAGTGAASTASGCAVIPTGAPSGSSVDANYATVDFSNACNSSIGTGVAAGFEQPYESVLAGVDAVLTVTDAQNLQSAKTNTDGKVSEVDEYFAGNPPGWATDDDGINTEIYSIANTGESLTTYRIDFLRADTLIPITVNNIAITVKDLDDTEFAEFGGINTYTLAQSTSVGVQNSGNNYRFEGTTSETSRSVSSWAEVRYGSANSVTMVLGTTNSQEVGARFGVSFTAASWGNAATNSVTVSEPTYTITYDGNGNDAGNVPAATSGQGALTIASNSGGLSKAGVAFNGWNAKNDGSGLALTPGSSYTPSADMTLYAIYPAANSVPGTPTGVTASAGNAQATVSWTAPASNGGAAITGYTVTSSPGGKQCTTTGATSCIVTGLTNGTAYTFTVTANNSAGTSAASSASSAVTPTGSALTPTFATPTSTADGFTVQVSNYDGAYTWAVSTDAGSATISDSGLVMVTGLTARQSATVTVTTTRTGYASGSASASGRAAIDTDGDGVPDSEDAFPNNPNESADTDGDGVGDNADAFPNDASESVDTDGDGIGNNADTDSDGDGVPDDEDAFPYDATESADSDGDGVGDNADAFPNDATESADSDGDGVGDNADAFPNDASESVDTDGDGIGNNADTDSDGDGVPDDEDAFPYDATESADSDGDGVGDNADVSPNDPTESADADGDGVGDDADAFPNDASESADTDGDGIGNNADPDDDNDGIPDVDDAYPNAVTVATASGVTLQTTPPSEYSSCSVTKEMAVSVVPDRYAPVAEGGTGVGVDFSLSGCSTTAPETLTIEIDLGAAPAEGSVAYKIDADGVWTAIPGATINGSVVTYSITDNDGVLDQNGELGKIRDPMTVARPYSAPLPVPTLPGTLLGLLALVMAGLGWRRLV